MMLRLLLILSIFIYSCGKEDKNREMCAVYGEDCHPAKATPTPEPKVGPPGPQGPIGPQGPKGDKGDAGVPGTSCTIASVIGGANITCGSTVTFLANGVNGINGTNGTNGSNGVSCSVTQLAQSHDTPTGGASITCGVSTVIVINGANGTDGSAAYAIVASVDPCGPSGGYDEVFLRMASGALVALFTQSSDATTARLSYLMDGVSYQTTDSQHCYFSLSTDGNGVRTINTTSPVVTSESWQTY